MAAYKPCGRVSAADCVAPAKSRVVTVKAAVAPAVMRDKLVPRAVEVLPQRHMPHCAVNEVYGLPATGMSWKRRVDGMIDAESDGQNACKLDHDNLMP